MFTVALIGPDGSGKTTVGKRLRETLPIPVEYIYMGINHEASEHLLPTTRMVRKLRQLTGRQKDAGGPREKPSADPATQTQTQTRKSIVKRSAKALKSSLSLLNRFAEEWYRQGVAWRHLRKQRVVIFDRHFFADYYAYDIAGDSSKRWTQRLHGFVLTRYYPHPDLLLFLDAPAEVLFARKGEGTIELLQQRREDYLAMKDLVKHFEVVDANRDLEAVVADVADRIIRYYQQYAGPS